jgi:hypothetical protein
MKLHARRARFTLLVLCAVLPSAGCTSRQLLTPLGQHQEYPAASLPRTGTSFVDLEQPAYVAMIGVSSGNPHFPDVPVVFTARYPLWNTDRLHFDAGRHRLRPQRRTAILPMNCSREQQPSLHGCRRPPALLPGIRYYDPQNYRGGVGYVIIITSDAFIDPFPLAEDLYYEALMDHEMVVLLRDNDLEASAHALDVVLERRLAGRVWSAQLVTWK